MVNDCEQGIEELMTRTYYVTDRKWKDSALLIGRSNRDNMEIRNKGRKLGAFISDPTTETENMVNLYAFYVLNLALRIALLETVGVRIDSTIKD